MRVLFLVYFYLCLVVKGETISTEATAGYSSSNWIWQFTGYTGENPDISLNEGDKLQVDHNAPGHPLKICPGSLTFSDCLSASTGTQGPNAGTIDTYTFLTSGTFTYICTAHASMIGVITINSVGGTGDPHLKLANGGVADFRGRNDTFFNFLSSPGFSMNIKTTEADFTLRKKLLVHGSFMTEAHLHFQDMRVSLIGSAIGSTNLIVVNGTCKSDTFRLGAHRAITCEDIKIQTDYSSVKMMTSDWTVTLRCNRVYNKVKGPDTRIDLDIRKLKDVPSHGILGQSYYFESDVSGEVDEYPLEGEFTTRAMAMGAIEGSYLDYIVPTAFETRFKYSQFDTLSLSHEKVSSRLGVATASEI